MLEIFCMRTHWEENRSCNWISRNYWRGSQNHK